MSSLALPLLWPLMLPPILLNVIFILTLFSSHLIGHIFSVQQPSSSFIWHLLLIPCFFQLSPSLVVNPLKTIWFNLLLLQKTLSSPVSFHFFSPVLSSLLPPCSYWTNLLETRLGSFLSCKSTVCNLKCNFDHDILLPKFSHNFQNTV